MIRQEKLGKGNQYGEIIVKTPYQKLVYHVLASRGTESAVNLDLLEKQYRISLMKEYLGYLCKRTDFQTWTASTHEKLDRMGENGLKYPEYQLLEAYLLHLEGEDDQASEILERYQNKSFYHNELELAGIYLYLCTQTGLYRDVYKRQGRIFAADPWVSDPMDTRIDFFLFHLSVTDDHTADLRIIRIQPAGKHSGGDHLRFFAVRWFPHEFLINSGIIFIHPAFP